MSYEEFFRHAMWGENAPRTLVPFEYQRRLALEEKWPDLIDVPTGLGKTAAVALAWLWRRRFDDRFRHGTPRRLVYCLPMRVLVEQTHESVVRWLDRLGMLAGSAKWDDEPGKQGLREYRPEPGAKHVSGGGWADSRGLDGAPIAVHLLMGGADRTDWVSWPERDAILIGTQDMLLSRALNRGYAAGRARWPMDFGLLNSDCLWVLDEVQLMDTGLATSLQLDAWRRMLRLRAGNGFPSEVENPVAHSCRSLWMSATMARHWLDSAVDWQPRASQAWKCRHELRDADLHQGTVERLFENKKSLQKEAVARLDKPRTQENRIDKVDARDKTRRYVDELAEAVKKQKSKGGLSLVIVNTVERAVMLYDVLREQPEKLQVDLIHSRFRPMERQRWRQLFAGDSQQPRIIVSTQVVEAGVDISSKVLFTELAPWASLIQRLGRCARRAGENGAVYWMDVAAHESTALPYTLDELTEAKRQLEAKALIDVGLKSLTNIKDSLDRPESAGHAKKLFPYNPRFVPRDKDLFDLFDTTPDLTGADVDISRYIRDGRELDVQVFWRDIEDEPGKRLRPDRRELCAVAFHRFREVSAELLKRGRVWRQNYRKGWERLFADQTELIYPGQVFLLEASCGGYDTARGWTGDPNDRTFELLSVEPDSNGPTRALEEDDSVEESESLSELPGWVKLSEHLWHVCEHAETIGRDLLAESDSRLSKLAARWHDRGKAHECFEANFKPGVLEEAKAGQLQGEPAAKAPDGKSREGKARDKSQDAWRRYQPRAGDEDDKRRPGFRHELASALAILETLRQARPDHDAFKWPEGLDRAEYECNSMTDGLPIPSSPAADELAELSRDEFDLLLYLVAAHHGKVRMSLRSSPDDTKTDVPDPCPAECRQARGVRDRDRLPPSKMPDSNGSVMEAVAVCLNLDPMELGLSCRYGPSWRERMHRLLEKLGPFRLAYLETLLRVADWRASRQEAEKALEVSGRRFQKEGTE